MSAMTKSQSAAYWRLWSAACKAQGWTKADGMDSAAVDAKRKECLIECGFESSRDIDSGAGFSRWKSLCERLSGKLSGAIAEVRKSSPADKRRWVVENEMIPCLAFYAPTGTTDRRKWAEHYVGVIVRETVRTDTVDFDRLDEVQLTRLMATLNARLGSKRRAAGHSMHDMYTGAGCRCRCAACKAVATPVTTGPF